MPCSTMPYTVPCAAAPAPAAAIEKKIMLKKLNALRGAVQEFYLSAFLFARIE